MKFLPLFFIRAIQAFIILSILFMFSLSFSFQNLAIESKEVVSSTPDSSPIPKGPFHETFFIENPEYISDGFDFPIGKPNAEEYYNAQGFQVNQHLGEDWNGNGGGNTDLGDSIFSIANGYVSEAEDHFSGWGKVIRVVHYLASENQFIESLYAHCDTICVVVGQKVKREELIGTIGTAGGAYPAHLHLELRDTIGLEIGGGYSSDTTGYLNPTEFILGHY